MRPLLILAVLPAVSWGSVASRMALPAVSAPLAPLWEARAASMAEGDVASGSFLDSRIASSMAGLYEQWRGEQTIGIASPYLKEIVRDFVREEGGKLSSLPEGARSLENFSVNRSFYLLALTVNLQDKDPSVREPAHRVLRSQHSRLPEIVQRALRAVMVDIWDEDAQMRAANVLLPGSAPPQSF